MRCFGRNLPDHCCYINNKPCPFLEENTEKGYRWTCRLRRESDSWDSVISNRIYDTGPGSPGYAFRDTTYKNCRDYQCKECGMLERGEISEAEYEILKAPGHRLGK